MFEIMSKQSVSEFRKLVNSLSYNRFSGEAGRISRLILNYVEYIKHFAVFLETKDLRNGVIRSTLRAALYNWTEHICPNSSTFYGTPR